MSVVSWVLAGTTTCVLIWMAFRHWKRMGSLDSRLAMGDPTLLNDSNVHIEEVIQAPMGSQLHDQKMVIAMDNPLK